MSDYEQGAPAWDATSSEPETGKKDAAKEQASQLKDHAADSAGHVAGTAREQIQNVANETKTQARGLVDQARTELHDQAAAQQSRVADGLRSVGDELSEMADASTSGGLASELVGQASSRVSSVAGWLDDRDPGSLVGELRSFASRQPLAFIAAAAVGGILAGRLTRSVTGNDFEKGRHDHADGGTPAETPIYASVAETHQATTPSDVPTPFTIPEPTPSNGAFTEGQTL